MCDNFKKDLEAGQEIENMFVEKLTKNNPGATITKSEGYFTGRDIQMTKTDGTSYTFEVKYDRMVDITGNVAIEVAYAGTASGICNSQADFIIYYCKGIFRYANPKEVYGKIIERERIKGGDNKLSELILIKREDFITIFNKYV